MSGRKRRSDDVVGCLGDDQVAAITAHLSSVGAMDIGSFNRFFPGVKRSQLEGYFCINSTDGRTGTISINGETAFMPVGKTGNKRSRGGGGARAGQSLNTMTQIESWDEPLMSATVAQMQAHLLQEGGAMNFGNFTRAFPGVKKAQLADHFHFHSGVISVEETGAETIDPTDPATLKAMTAYLRANDGAAPMGKFMRAFSGVKKAQLTSHFVFPDRCTIALQGTFPMGMTGCADGAVDAATLKAMNEYVRNAGGTANLGNFVREFKGVKKTQLAAHFVFPDRSTITLPPQTTTKAAGAVGKTGWQIKPQGGAIKPVRPGGWQQVGIKPVRPAVQRGGRQPATMADLDADKLEELRVYVDSQGGTVNMGKLSRAFPGVKRAQIELNFPGVTLVGAR